MTGYLPGNTTVVFDFMVPTLMVFNLFKQLLNNIFGAHLHDDQTSSMLFILLSISRTFVRRRLLLRHWQQAEINTITAPADRLAVGVIQFLNLCVVIE